MSMLPEHLEFQKKRNEEEVIEKKSELDILKHDLKIMSDARCKVTLYNIIKNWEEF